MPGGTATKECPSLQNKKYPHRELPHSGKKAKKREEEGEIVEGYSFTKVICNDINEPPRSKLQGIQYQRPSLDGRG